MTWKAFFIGVVPTFLLVLVLYFSYEYWEWKARPDNCKDYLGAGNPCNDLNCEKNEYGTCKGIFNEEEKKT